MLVQPRRLVILAALIGLTVQLPLSQDTATSKQPQGKQIQPQNTNTSNESTICTAPPKCTLQLIERFRQRTNSTACLDNLKKFFAELNETETQLSKASTKVELPAEDGASDEIDYDSAGPGASSEVHEEKHSTKVRHISYRDLLLKLRNTRANVNATQCETRLDFLLAIYTAKSSKDSNAQVQKLLARINPKNRGEGGDDLISLLHTFNLIGDKDSTKGTIKQEGVSRKPPLAEGGKGGNSSNVSPADVKKLKENSKVKAKNDTAGNPTSKPKSEGSAGKGQQGKRDEKIGKSRKEEQKSRKVLNSSSTAAPKESSKENNGTATATSKKHTGKLVDDSKTKNKHVSDLKKSHGLKKSKEQQLTSAKPKETLNKETKEQQKAIIPKSNKTENLQKVEAAQHTVPALSEKIQIVVRTKTENCPEADEGKEAQDEGAAEWKAQIHLKERELEWQTSQPRDSSPEGTRVKLTLKEGKEQQPAAGLELKKTNKDVESGIINNEKAKIGIHLKRAMVDHANRDGSRQN